MWVLSASSSPRLVVMAPSTLQPLQHHSARTPLQLPDSPVQTFRLSSSSEPRLQRTQPVLWPLQLSRQSSAPCHSHLASCFGSFVRQSLSRRGSGVASLPASPLFYSRFCWQCRSRAWLPGLPRPRAVNHAQSVKLPSRASSDTSDTMWGKMVSSRRRWRLNSSLALLIT